MNRKQSLILVLAIVILIAVGSWIAGSMIQSPAEAAARTAPPKPSPILVLVEKRVLTANIVTRGTAHYGFPTSISLVPSTLKPNIGVITTLPEADSQLDEGALVVTVSGRPVFILQGDIPVYRDFVPGISGEDVHQLEEALQRLGFDPGTIDGTYDAQTSTAVSNWYHAARWPPFAATDEQETTIRTLERELATAVNNKQAADDAASLAPLAVEVAKAQADSNIANSTDSTTARLEGQIAIQTAISAQAAAERDAQLAADVIAQISADLEKARHDAGVKLPADEIIFLPELPVRVENLHATIGNSSNQPILTVTNNQLAIDSALPLDEGALIEAGMQVSIDEANLGIKATGVVYRVADTPGTDGVDGFHIYFETLIEDAPTTLAGVSLRLTIPIQTTGEKVTAVPVSALSLGTDGSTRVQVENDGIFEFIVVEPGLSADGFVEVTPLDGTLEAGQFVVIGYQ